MSNNNEHLDINKLLNDFNDEGPEEINLDTFFNSSDSINDEDIELTKELTEDLNKEAVDLVESINLDDLPEENKEDSIDMIIDDILNEDNQTKPVIEDSSGFDIELKDDIPIEEKTFEESMAESGFNKDYLSTLGIDLDDIDGYPGNNKKEVKSKDIKNNTKDENKDKSIENEEVKKNILNEIVEKLDTKKQGKIVYVFIGLSILAIVFVVLTSSSESKTLKNKKSIVLPIQNESKDEKSSNINVLNSKGGKITDKDSLNFSLFLKDMDEMKDNIISLENQDKKIINLYVDGSITELEAKSYYRKSMEAKEEISLFLKKSNIMDSYIDLYAISDKVVRESVALSKSVLTGLNNGEKNEYFKDLFIQFDKNTHATNNEFKNTLISHLNKFNINYEIINNEVVVKNI